MLGPLWDAQLELRVKAGMLPAGALSQGVLAEDLSAFDAQHREEQAAVSKAASGCATKPHADPTEDSKVDLTVDSIQANGTRSKVSVRLSALPEERRGIVQSALQMGPEEPCGQRRLAEQGQHRAAGTHSAGAAAGKR